MLTIPEVLWSTMLDSFAAAPRGVERVAYLDGVTILDREGRRRSVVTTVTIPDAELTPGYYRVTGDAISKAGAHLFDHGLRRLAQVHTHGDDDTAHSETDDLMAYSQRPGSLSVVLPRHGARRPGPLDGTVHERVQDDWEPLDAAQAAQRIRLVPSVVDQARSVTGTSADRSRSRSGWRAWLRGRVPAAATAVVQHWSR